MKSYYTEYVNHCLRHYFRHPLPISDNKAEIDNWNACKRACDTLKSSENDLLEEIYTCKERVADGVYQTARRHNIKYNDLWDLMHKAEKLVAIERGLL